MGGTLIGWTGKAEGVAALRGRAWQSWRKSSRSSGDAKTRLGMMKAWFLAM